MTRTLANLLSRCEGNLAEIGVFLGGTFYEFVPVAERAGFRAWAVDSFVGMAEPGPFDSPRYPTGRLSVGGLQAWQEGFRKQFKITPDRYEVVAGYVPECLTAIPESVRFWLIRIDLDHYAPTLDALHWGWARLVPGGWLTSHDWFPKQTERGASRAAHEFCAVRASARDVAEIREDDKEIYWQKRKEV